MTPPVFFTVCIPAYNRAKFLAPLLDSILAQDFDGFDILIHEDHSPQRAEIGKIVADYQERHPGRILYTENVVNLGYDANIRSLIGAATGKYCFFMGNDDIMARGALHSASDAIHRYQNIGILIRSYAWFKTDPSQPEDTIRYFSEERFFPAGPDTIGTFFRRSGVISGFVVSVEKARAVATDRFDGFLFYQMYLTASILAHANGVFTPAVLTFSRDTEAPDFGNSVSERAVFRPGGYTPEARLYMLSGMLKIAKSVEETAKVKIYEKIRTDISNYIYPYIRDQLHLPFKEYFGFYRSLKYLGLGVSLYFHLIVWSAFVLKEKNFDLLVALVRKRLGRTPRLGTVYGGTKKI